MSAPSGRKEFDVIPARSASMRPVHERAAAPKGNLQDAMEELACKPPARERPIAILVAHGMGQQVPFETLDLVAKGLETGPPPRGAPGEAVEPAVSWEVTRQGVSVVRAGETDLRRVELTLRGTVPPGGPSVVQKEVHLYEAYWAPLTEGKVSIADVVSFLVSGGLNGARNASRKGGPGPGGRLERVVFGRTRRFPPVGGATLILLCALGVLLSLVAMNLLAPAFIAGKLGRWEAVADNLTYGLFAFLVLAVMLAAHVLESGWARRRAHGNPAARPGLEARRKAGMLAFAWGLGGALGFLVGSATLLLLHAAARAPGLPVQDLGFRLLAWWCVASLVAAVGLFVIGKRGTGAGILVGGLAPGALWALWVYARWSETAIAAAGALLAAVVLFLCLRPQEWNDPPREPAPPAPPAPGAPARPATPPTPAERQKAEAAARRAGDILRERAQRYRAFQLSILFAAATASLLLVVAEPLAALLEGALGVPPLPGVRPLAYAMAALALFSTLAIGGVALSAAPRREALQNLLAALLAAGALVALVALLPAEEGNPSPWLVLGAWVLVAAIGLLVRRLLIQYLGDVAAYVSSHTLDKFDQVRTDIKARVKKVGDAVYGMRDPTPGSKDPLYERVVVVAHSLGSVAAYDMLNALLLDDEIARDAAKTAPASGAQANCVRERTRALVTFGSPLDRTAFVFATQGPRMETREALAARIQPLLDVPEDRARIRWINVYSDGDIIGSPLVLYDPPPDDPLPAEGPLPCRVHNVEDPDATTPLAAHNEYWENSTLWRHVVHEVLAP